MMTGDTVTMTKQQSDYAPHDSDNLDEGWNAVREYLNDAVLIAFDGCHKIYLAMDEAEADFFRKNYQPVDEFDNGGVLEGLSPAELYEELTEWWDASCSLRFVQAVWRDSEDPNAGFVSLISQCAGWKDDEDEDEE